MIELKNINKIDAMEADKSFFAGDLDPEIIINTINEIIDRVTYLQDKINLIENRFLEYDTKFFELTQQQTNNQETNQNE